MSDIGLHVEFVPDGIGRDRLKIVHDGETRELHGIDLAAELPDTALSQLLDAIDLLWDELSDGIER